MGCIIPMGMATLFFVSMAVYFIVSDEPSAPPQYIVDAESEVDERVKELEERKKLQGTYQKILL